jgi:hypothetical protein
MQGDPVKHSDDCLRATMARCRSLAVAAMTAATAEILPGDDITPAAWERVPASLRARLAHTLAVIANSPPPPPRGQAMRSVPAPRGISRIRPG